MKAPSKSKDTAKEVRLDEAAQAALDESIRRQKLAFDRKIVGRSKASETSLKGVEALARADGLDVVKKGNMRKNRYLLNIPARLAASTAGRLGSLARLDTQNPVLYIDFPEGRLKFSGTLFFSKNKYMTLRLAQKEVLCEDIFENMIVFSEHHWIGTAEENPEELPMPLPSTLQRTEESKADAFQDARKQVIECTQAEPSSQEASQAVPMRMSQRAVKRPKYAERVSSDDEEASSTSREEGRTTRSSHSESSDQSKSPARSGPTSHSQGAKQSTLLEYISQSQQTSQATATPSQRSNSQGTTQRKGRKPALVSDDDSDEEITILSDKEPSSLEKRNQPLRTARQASKMLPKIDEMGDEGESNNTDSSTEDSDFEG